MAKRTSKASRNDGEYALVYSTDPLPPACPKCKNQQSSCACSAQPYTGRLTPHVRIERKGRGGKTVTLIYDLPADEGLLKELCTRCKRSLSVGGTWYTEAGQGFVELQGEHRSKVEAILIEFNTTAV